MRNLRSNVQSQDFKVLRPIRFFPRDFFGPIVSHNRSSNDPYRNQGTVDFNSFRVPTSDLLKNSIRRILVNKNFKVLRRPLDNELSSTSTEEISLPTITKLPHREEERKTTRSHNVNGSLNYINYKDLQVRPEHLRIPLEPIIDKEENARVETKVTMKTGFFGKAVEDVYSEPNGYKKQKKSLKDKSLLRKKMNQNSVQTPNKSYRRRLPRKNKENVKPSSTEENIAMFTFGRKINYSRIY